MVFKIARLIRKINPYRLGASGLGFIGKVSAVRPIIADLSVSQTLSAHTLQSGTMVWRRKVGFVDGFRSFQDFLDSFTSGVGHQSFELVGSLFGAVIAISGFGVINADSVVGSGGVRADQGSRPLSQTFIGPIVLKKSTFWSNI